MANIAFGNKPESGNPDAFIKNTFRFCYRLLTINTEHLPAALFGGMN
jgi:hypothetical protein